MQSNWEGAIGLGMADDLTGPFERGDQGIVASYFDAEEATDGSSLLRQEVV